MKNLRTLFLLIFASILSVNTLACRFEYHGHSSNNDLKTIKEQTIQAKDIKNIAVKTDAGDISILTWDKNEIYIKISGNSKAKDKMTFNINENKGFVEVSGEKSNSFLNFNNFNVKIEIKVPKAFNSKLLTKGGDVRIEDLIGEQYIRTSGGDLILKNITGKIDGSTSGGDIHIDDIKGAIEISTSGGDIIAKNFNGDFNASTSGGDVKLAGSNSKIHASTSGGNISLIYSGENKGIDLSTSGGNIDIKIPSDFGAKADLHTSGGEISVQLNTSNIEKISQSKFKADLNNGGALLHAETSGGNINVSKK
ncbi:MAG: DUF4097 family beta strand repeat-containing protein [Bacteroidota bacterium]|nr:DUF4097 family beta strand repeat-containing protein [Bacteroidota bacterium]